ncbi:hypothetical protein [Levilactobacillus bambusae]|uniref:hypothetical protein n=1 Tax=Levilactobacillus bambusae TaxID=2024736 RepID=UPI001403262A|nr:hypothetical protein [Levilactobacillus bambusae]
MNMITYLEDQINFLTEQVNDAKKQNNEMMRVMTESRRDEAAHILEAIHSGQITTL